MTMSKVYVVTADDNNSFVVGVGASKEAAQTVIDNFNAEQNTYNTNRNAQYANDHIEEMAVWRRRVANGEVVAPPIKYVLENKYYFDVEEFDLEY